MGSMLSAELGQEEAVSIRALRPTSFPISGCRFAERCPVARPDCKSTEQVIRIVKEREVRCHYAE